MGIPQTMSSHRRLEYSFLEQSLALFLCLLVSIEARRCRCFYRGTYTRDVSTDVTSFVNTFVMTFSLPMKGRTWTRKRTAAHVLMTALYCAGTVCENSQVLNWSFVQNQMGKTALLCLLDIARHEHTSLSEPYYTCWTISCTVALFQYSIQKLAFN